MQHAYVAKCNMPMSQNATCLCRKMQHTYVAKCNIPMSQNVTYLCRKMLL